MPQPLLEFESVDRLIPDRSTGGVIGFDSPAVYAITSGIWILDSAEIDGQLRLHPGDVLLVKQPTEHRLFSVATDDETDHQQQAAVLRFECRRKEQETSSETPTESPFFHLRSVFIPSVPAAGAVDVLHEVSQVLVSLMAAMSTPSHASGSVSGVDPEIAQVILAMEHAPANAWTIQRLAMEAGISRSALALKFKEQTGQTPSEYLLNIRMRLADQMLRGRQQHLKEIARRTGYQSVSAFSTAFKRWSGSPPSVHRRRPAN